MSASGSFDLISYTDYEYECIACEYEYRKSVL